MNIIHNLHWKNNYYYSSKWRKYLSCLYNKYHNEYLLILGYSPKTISLYCWILHSPTKFSEIWETETYFYTFSETFDSLNLNICKKLIIFKRFAQGHFRPGLFKNSSKSTGNSNLCACRFHLPFWIHHLILFRKWQWICNQ